MATVLCPSLVALDPVPCNDPKCSASHTHTPAFCDPCKAVHAQVHSSIHLASIGHRLRVDGPVAPVRCIVCCPIGMEPSAQYLFIGPEHYAVHARTSAHRAKLARLPKAEAGIGLGRPGEYNLDRPYAAKRSSTMPSRSSTSMSFDGAITPPPGPAPVPLAENEYVLCTLCHTVLPVPPVDPAYARTDPKARIVSHGSDATVVDSGRKLDARKSLGARPEDEDDDHDGTSTILTTTDPKAESETRKYLVLAHHNAHDPEHDRRTRFPRFKEAWERRMRKQTMAAGDETPPEDEKEGVLSGQIAASPSQLSLSSLSASPSVAVMGLDGEDVYSTYGRALKAFSDSRSNVGVATPPPPPPPKPEPEEEPIVDWESKLTNSPPYQAKYTPTRSVSSSSVNSVDSSGKKFARDSTGRAFPVDENGRLILHNGNLPLQIPSHLLPFMSPFAPSSGLGLTTESEPSVSDSAETRSEFKAPPPPPALPKKAPSPKPTASTFKDPGPPPPLAAHRRTTSSSSPKPRVVSSPVPRSTMSPQPRATPSPQPRAIASPQPTPPKPPVQRTASVASSSMSKPYQPSPSPPPRLAFDTYGRVLKLGMRGWEVDVGGEFMPSEPDTSEPPSAIEREPTPEPPRDPTPEPEPESEEEEERYGRPPSPATEVGVRGEAIVSAPQRYTLGQNRSMTLGSSRTVSSSSANGDSKYGDSSRASSSMSNRSNSTGYGGYGGAGGSTGYGGSTTTSTRGDTGFGGTTTGFGGSGFGAAAGDRGFTSSVPVRTSGFVHTPSSGPSIYDRSHSRTQSHSDDRTVSTSQALVTTSQALATRAPPPPQSSRTASSSSVKTGSTGYTPPSLYGSTGPTTKATRPVAARRSTGEWAMLEGQARDSGRDAGTGGWTPPVRPESAQSGKWAHTKSPDVLSAIGDEEESASGNSHSEASELIREFSGKTVASRAARVSSPAPERKQSSPLAPRTHQRAGSLSSRQSAPERPVFSSLSSRQAGSRQMSTPPPRQFTSPPPRQFASPPPGQSPTPTGRPFSPSAAWNKLTPGSPHSQSQSSSVDEFGGLGFAESSSFDEKTFLADLGFGLGKPPRAPSPPSSDGEDDPASPADEDPMSEPESPVRRPESSARASSPDPSEGPVRPPSPSPARPSYHVRIVTPPKRVDTPPSRGSGHTATPVRKVTPPRRKGTPPPARALSPSTDSRPSTPTQFTSSASPVRPTQRSPAPAQPSPPAPVRSTAPVRSMIPVRSGTARPAPSRNSTIRARAPSPLQREVQAEAPPPPPVPAPVTPSTARVPTTPTTPSARAPATPATPSSVRAPASSAVPSSPGLVPASPRDPNSPKPVMRTRVRARPMGTSSSVISGHGGRSVVSGYGGGSVVSGYGGGSVVSGYGGGGSVVSGYDNESVVSGGPSKADSESEAGPSFPVVPQPRPSVAIPAHLTTAHRPRGDSIISSDSDALSSVVTPLSPRIVKALRERGFEVETPIAEERDSEVEEVAQNLAGMNLNITLPEVEIEEVRMGPIELLDTHSSGSASPIAPEGAPSDAGSLFSRAASPKPVPTIPMFSTSRAPTMSTKTPPITPPKATQRVQRGLDTTPKSQRSAAFPGGFLSQPESPPEQGRAPGPGSVFSRGPESPPPRGADELKWKLDLPTHSSDPLGFQSLLSGIESGESTFGLGDFAESSAKHADAHAGEITNASPSSERLTPTRSAIPASETPLMRDADGDATDDEEEEEEELEEGEEDQEEDDEEEEADQEDQPEGGEERSGFTSSSEEGARTETDGLDHLTESIGEPFRHQLEPTPAAPAPVAQQHLGAQILGPGPLHESPRLVSPPPLPGGFEAEFIEQPNIPQLAEYTEYEDESPMPDEVLALRPVICDACRAPMPFSKWPEHVARAVHRRNAARYAQWLFDEITAQHPAGADHDSADARERWAEASRLDPREAHPSEYAFCEVCQVFLVRGDHEHFQGKRHLRCLRVLALNDAAELESVRGSVSEEEDGPSIKSFRPITASQAGVDWTQPRTRSRPGSTLGQQSQARSRPASTLGQQAFPPRPTA